MKEFERVGEDQLGVSTGGTKEDEENSGKEGRTNMIYFLKRTFKYINKILMIKMDNYSRDLS